MVPGPICRSDFAKDLTVLVGENNVGKRLRGQKDWTQEALAGRAVLDRSYVAGIEAGLRNPSTKPPAKIARALGATLSELFRDVG